MWPYPANQSYSHKSQLSKEEALRAIWTISIHSAARGDELQRIQSSTAVSSVWGSLRLWYAVLGPLDHRSAVPAADLEDAMYAAPAAV